MIINWHNITAIVAAIVTVTIAIGGVMLALMRGFFVTKKNCEESQTVCQQHVCKKVDEIRTDVKKNGEIVSSHYAEIKGDLGEIKGKLGIPIERT